MMAGKGYERGEAYSHCDVRFYDIENIHVMRNSLETLLELLAISHNPRGDPQDRPPDALASVLDARHCLSPASSRLSG